MDKSEFRRRKEESWRRLEQQVRKRRQSFTSTESLTSFIQLYQMVASDLSYANTYFPNEPVTRYLNGLVTSAHHRLYRESSGGLRSIWRFLSAGFPAKLRQYAPYFIMSLLVTIGGAVFGYILVLQNPANAYGLLPSSLLNAVHPLQAGPHNVDGPLMSSTIMTHNMLVTLMAFIGGITLGLFTLYSLWQNGIILGVLAAIFQTHHRALMFWSLIVPHGVTELTAIFIGGAGGLLFAHRLVAPGQMARKTSVQVGLTDAIQLLLGTVPMLIIAGTIEGCITPTFLPMGIKFGIAAVTFVGWVLYFTLAGRPRVRRAIKV